MNAKAPMILGIALAIAAALPANAVIEEQVVRSASGYAAESDELRELGTLEERRFSAADRAAYTKSRSTLKAAWKRAPDHWIYDASLELFFDADGDGYFRYVSVRFDVDTVYDRAWVYAVLYLSPDGEVWELLHETDDFRIKGAGPHDAYEVEVELVSGYPPGDYDLLIEIYDADTGLFADELGPAETPAFALLPLEDARHDVPESVVVIREEGGGGAFGWPALAVLAALAGAARARRAGRHRPAS